MQDPLVAAGDPDGDGLGLVLDGVDRPGQLLDLACVNAVTTSSMSAAGLTLPDSRWYASTGAVRHQVAGNPDNLTAVLASRWPL